MMVALFGGPMGWGLTGVSRETTVWGPLNLKHCHLRFVR